MSGAVFEAVFFQVAVLLQPAVDFFAIAGVYDHEAEGFAIRIFQVIDQHIIQHSTVFVGHQRVADLAGFHRMDTAGGQSVQEFARRRVFEIEATHVRDVEHAHRGAASVVLFDN